MYFFKKEIQTAFLQKITPFFSYDYYDNTIEKLSTIISIFFTECEKKVNRKVYKKTEISYINQRSDSEKNEKS